MCRLTTAQRLWWMSLSSINTMLYFFICAYTIYKGTVERRTSSYVILLVYLLALFLCVLYLLDFFLNAFFFQEQYCVFTVWFIFFLLNTFWHYSDGMRKCAIQKQASLQLRTIVSEHFYSTYNPDIYMSNDAWFCPIFQVKMKISSRSICVLIYVMLNVKIPW